MFGKSVKRAALGGAVALCALAVAPAAQAEDFLSALFGAFGGGRSRGPEIVRVPYANESEPGGPQDFPSQGDNPGPRIVTYGGGQAYCVRSCDGRYFPLQGSDKESRAASCNSFCPASKTEVVYGSHIDDAATTSGKPYSELPNAFRYRTEIVAGCTCNGKDQFGLARVKVEDDPTLRKGDLVAGADGLMVAGRSADRRGASLDFTPASKAVQARYQHVPVVAKE
jgi:hypothetical protein